MKNLCITFEKLRLVPLTVVVEVFGEVVDVVELVFMVGVEVVTGIVEEVWLEEAVAAVVLKVVLVEVDVAGIELM